MIGVFESDRKRAIRGNGDPVYQVGRGDREENIIRREGGVYCVVDFSGAGQFYVDLGKTGRAFRAVVFNFVLFAY